MLNRFILLSLLSMTACAAQNNLPSAIMRTSDLPGWQQEEHLPALKAFVNSCARVTALPDNQPLHQSLPQFGTMKPWKALCRKAASIQDAQQAKTFFENEFVPHLVEGKGTFTGYHVIGLHGSLTPSARYRYPVYATPAQQYLSLTRQEIDTGALTGKAKVLVWVDDPVQLFFLHVQGSGLVAFEDGSSRLIGFDSKTTRPYYSIGAYMIQQAMIPKEVISAQTIKQWLYAHPERMNEVLWKNTAYVFFTLKEKRAAIGGEGVPLTPYHSLAVDKAHLPYGIPLWVNTTLTATKQPWQRLMVAQDTGSAIKGKVRGDIFFGSEEQAEQYAGVQNSAGSYYLLLPKAH